MLLNNNDKKANDRILYKTKPNMILGCKNAIYGFVLLGIILFISPMIIQFVGELQVYLISHIQLPLTRYTAIAFFVVILIDIIYIIWQLLGWYSVEYALTDSKIIIKSGVLSTKKNYMPYATIQDINTSQGFLAKMFNVGSVAVFSAYDNNQMELKNVSNPSEVEEIIFSRMTGPRNFQAPPQRVPHRQRPPVEDKNAYLGRNELYDEYEPITPITHERNSHPRRDYEYYPEEGNFNEGQRHSYEYEPYDNGLGSRPVNRSQDSYYDEVRDDYSRGGDDYYQNYDSENYYDGYGDETSQSEPVDIDSSENAIQRHFDKFKK